MSFRKKYVDYINGLDTNDGSYAHPWKTLTYALNSSVHQQKDKIHLLSDIPLSTPETLPTYSAYYVNQIVGVNSLDLS